MGDVPGLDFKKAQDCINYAWRDIREARRWSFLSSETSIDIPDKIVAGTASVTQFSDVVVGNATAKTAWDALTLNLPITYRQFRVGSGPLYQIIAYDSVGDSTTNPWNTNGDAGALRLERTYKEATDATETYQIYRAYFAMPADFLAFTQIKDIQNGRNLNLDLTRSDLDNWKDPQRLSFGYPSYVAAWTGDPNNSGLPRFELWPHMFTAYSYVVRYERLGADFASDTESLPQIIPESLLLERALVYACKWANDNRGRYEPLKATDWRSSIGAHEIAYREMLGKSKIMDEELYPQDLSYEPEKFRKSAGNARYWQSHEFSTI